MSDTFRADDTTDAFKKAVEKGTEVQRDFIRQYSATQQDIMQNFLSMLQGFSEDWLAGTGQSACGAGPGCGRQSRNSKDSATLHERND